MGEGFIMMHVIGEGIILLGYMGGMLLYVRVKCINSQYEVSR